MKKKLIVLGSILLLISCFIFSQNYESRSFSMLNEVSKDLAEEIRETRKKVSALEFSCLLCNEIRVPFDSQSKTFYVSVDMEKREWEKFGFLSGQPEYEIVFPEDLFQRKKEDVIAKGERFQVFVYDETQYAEYGIVFTGLPVMDLSTDVGIWQENIQGTVVFYDTDFVVHGVKESQYRAHIRGNTSRMYPKKGYK